MKSRQLLSAPVIFADRFFMSEKSLAEISSLGGFAWADVKDHQELSDRLSGSRSVRIIVSEYVSINASVLEGAIGLKGVIAYGAGYDHIDVEAAASRGVLVCNCRGENAQGVAEMTFGLVLCLSRKIHLSDRYIRQDQWKRAESAALPEWIMGTEIQGKTMGIIGLGQIGSRVARMARGFDMRILAYDPFARPRGAKLVESTSLEELLARADIVTLHVPLTPATEKMINARTLAAMKPKAWLINTSRGKVIDEPALLKALQEKRIGGAALDVFANEPISADHPFAKLENVVLSPHMGGITHEAGERLSDAVVSQCREILEGRRPKCLIHPK